MQRNSSLFKKCSQPTLPEADVKQNDAVAQLSEHDEMILAYLVNVQHLQPEQALQKLMNSDEDIIELRTIESPATHPLRK